MVWVMLVRLITRCMQASSLGGTYAFAISLEGDTNG